MKRDRFIEAVQTFRANAFSVGIVRNMGPSRTLESVRTFLTNLDLKRIAECDGALFGRKLDQLTDELQRSMPVGGRYWGTARKCLNLFLRDALYDFYLRREYRLQRLEPHLEIPLDSFVGRALKREPEGIRLRRWKTVIGLTPSMSATFQEVAAKVAKRRGTVRVHLDVVYWRGTELPASI